MGRVQDGDHIHWFDDAGVAVVRECRIDLPPENEREFRAIARDNWIRTPHTLEEGQPRTSSHNGDRGVRRAKKGRAR